MPEMSKNQKKTWIAISGTMGSGKSTVLNYLKECGYPTYDCDQINFDLQKINEKGYLEIKNTFQENIFDENQNIDRQKLAHLIFSDPQKKEQLERIMHPLILEKLTEIKQEATSLSFVEVPLLYELGWEKYFDDDWLIVSDTSKLIERCLQTRPMNKSQIKKRLDAQMSTEKKMAKARKIIYNNGSLDHLYRSLDQLLERINNE